MEYLGQQDKRDMMMNSNYTYRFEEHPKQKGRCPKCGRVGVFRYFEDSTRAERLSIEFGKCERINSCGYYNTPLSGSYHAGQFIEAEAARIRQKYVDYHSAEQTLKYYQRNRFTLWLTQVYGAKITTSAIQNYHIGTGKKGNTIFWLVDENQNIWNGKKVLFDEFGHRSKKQAPRHLFSSTDGYKTCLFGQHLLANIDEEAIVCLVESEKTAIICSIFRPDLVWLATGGANGLTTKKAMALKARKVVLIPDMDAAGREGFLKRIATLELLKCQVKLFDIDPGTNDSTDIADIILQTF